MKLHFTTIGIGQPIVLLHAFPLNHEMFSLKEIDGYQIILPDFPGFGLSNMEMTDYSLETLAGSLKAQLDGFLGKPRPWILGGISMGGYLAFELIRQFPQSVSKLILISTRAGIDTPEARQNRLNMAENVLKSGIDNLVETMPQGLLGAATKASKPNVIQMVQNLIRQANPKAVSLAQRAMAQRRNQTSLLERIKQKTLILAGSEDILIQPAESKSMANSMPNGQLHLIEGVGHLIPVEAPELFENRIRGFKLENS